MSEMYLTLAEGFEKLAAGYRALASSQADSKDGTEMEESNVAQSKVAESPGPTAEMQEKPQISIETLRAVLAEKSRAGKTGEVKALLMKYDGGKLSGVKPEDYAALFAEAKAL